MTPEQRKAAAAKGQATRKANRERPEAWRAMRETALHQSAKAQAIADDDRGDPNTRAVAAAKAAALREKGIPATLPRTLEEWQARHERIVREATEARAAAAKAKARREDA